MIETGRISLVADRGIVRGGMLSQLLWILGTVVATGLSARLEIPHAPVPYTLQTLVVLLAGAFLGPVNGAFSQIAYLSAGLLGLPVFAGGAAGVVTLVGPTGGYLLAFPVAAAVVGLALNRRGGLLRSCAAMTAGLLIIFTLGTAQLYAVYTHDLSSAINAGFLIFSWWDVLKLSAAAMIYNEIAKKWRRVRGEN